MRKLILLLVAILGFTALSAQTKKTSVEIDYMEASARYLDPTQAFLTVPVIADLQVSQNKIQYTEKDAFKDFKVTEELIEMIPNLKQIALCRAARAHNADVILGATIDVITNSQGNLEITISGYPAVYTNFRNAKTSDMEVIREGAILSTSNGASLFAAPKSNIEVEEIDVKRAQ